MNGKVDDDLRVLLEVQIGSTPRGLKSIVLVWVDTAFNGGLVLPHREIRRLGCKPRGHSMSMGDETRGITGVKEFGTRAVAIWRLDRPRSWTGTLRTLHIRQAGARNVRCSNQVARRRVGV